VATNANQNGGLTTREREVLELVDARLEDEQIADRLRIARSTVALLLRSAMGKLDAHTRVEAAAKARNGADKNAEAR
jgi:LuxR family transcriptional regulator, regulator of acetate metabolism